MFDYKGERCRCLQAVYEGTWGRRDRWATLRAVFHAVRAFKVAAREKNTRHTRRESVSSLEDDDSDGGMSFDSAGSAPTTSTQQGTSLNATDTPRGLLFYLSVLRSIDGRGYLANQDDTLTTVLTTLAGTLKDFTESPYFPKMTFKNFPSSKTRSIPLTSLSVALHSRRLYRLQKRSCKQHQQ